MTHAIKPQVTIHTGASNPGMTPTARPHPANSYTRPSDRTCMRYIAAPALRIFCTVCHAPPSLSYAHTFPQTTILHCTGYRMGSGTLCRTATPSRQAHCTPRPPPAPQGCTALLQPPAHLLYEVHQLGVVSWRLLVVLAHALHRLVLRHVAAVLVRGQLARVRLQPGRVAVADLLSCVVRVQEAGWQ